MESQTQLKSLLAAQPENTQAARKYWKTRGVQIGVAASVVILCLLVPAIPRSVVQAVKDLAAEKPHSAEFVERVRQARASRPKFLPEQNATYRDTFADNILYLQGYEEFKSDENFKKDWILALNKFLQEKLELSDKVIVNYMSVEGPLVNELSVFKSQIKLESQEQDLARMKDFEELTRPRLVQVLGGERQFAKVREFEQQFFSEFSRKLAGSGLPTNQP